MNREENTSLEARGVSRCKLDGSLARQPPGALQPTIVMTFELDANYFQFRSELRPLLNKVRNALARGVGMVLHLTSPIAGEGVSTVARELAYAAAGISHCRSFLLDFNQGEGDQAAALGGTLPGIVSAYMAKGSVEVAAVSAGESVFHIAGFDIAGFDSFNFYAGGAEAVASGQVPLLAAAGTPEPCRTMAELYNHLCGAYNFIVVDCPPVQETPYFVPLSQDTPDVILVVQAEQTRIPIVMHAKEEVPALGGRLVGVVMNECRSYIPKLIDRLL